MFFQRLINPLSFSMYWTHHSSVTLYTKYTTKLPAAKPGSTPHMHAHSILLGNAEKSKNNINNHNQPNQVDY
jgi:hypothetical protein